MRRLITMAFLVMPSEHAWADGYLVDLAGFKKWPIAAQQVYVLGVLDQGMQAAYQYEPALSQVVEQCLVEVGTEPVVSAVIQTVVAWKRNEPVVDIIGDALADYCGQRGYKWPE